MAVYVLYTRQSVAQATEAWNQLNVAMETGDTTKIARVAEEHPNTTVAQMAALVLADSHLRSGCDQLFVNKAIGQQELSKAIDMYQLVARHSRVPSLMEQATYGLARAKEAKGDLEAAEKSYEEVVANWPKGAYAAAARQRAEDLKQPATKTLYDDFKNFDPKPAFSSKAGEQPTFNPSSLPNEGPPVSISDLKLDEKKPDVGKGKAEEKKALTPITKVKAEEKKAPAPTGKK
jgi:outer membrane protein assembly factor BamD (BamD/ComL family)